MTHATIDLRSDTVTRPDSAMLEAMTGAPLGDDVWGDDPTVARLYEAMCGLTGKEAALFFPSGTQSNLAAVLSHCARGDQVILGSRSHIYVHEAGGASALGGVSFCPIPNGEDGSLSPEAVASSLQPDDIHFARSRLLCLENTIGGRLVPEDTMFEGARIARGAGLALHLDGARLWNASIASGQPIAALCAPFDTVSLCFSKGMGTPAGTVLVGPKGLLEDRTRRLRKMLGGGMRQTGLLAAACLYALEHNFARLAEDHAHAARLAEALRALPGMGRVRQDTNMVFAEVPKARCAALSAFLLSRGILCAVGPTSRLVLHRDVDGRAVERVISAFSAFFGARDLSAS